MKTLIVYFVLCILYIKPLYAQYNKYKQQITQNGIIYKYQGEKTKEPFERVSISADKASPTLSDTNGNFILKFDNTEIGDDITNFKVRKKGFILYNSDITEQLSIKKEPYIIILCDSTSFLQKKKRMLNPALDNLKKKYETSIKQIDALKLSINEKQQEYEKLKEEYIRNSNNLEKIIDKISRFDESEMNTIERRINDLWKIGAYQAAIAYIDSIDINKNIQFYKDKLNNMYKIKEAKAISYCASGNIEKAQCEYRSIAQENPKEFLYNYKYASFCYDYSMYDEAKKYYEQALKLTSNNKLIFKILLILGELNERNKKYDEAKKIYQQIISLAITNKSEYSDLHIATAYLSLGDLYRNTYQTEEASIYLLKSIRTYDSLYTEMPYIKSIKKSYAQSLTSFADFYMDNYNDPSTTIKLIKESINIREEICKEDSTEIPSLAISYALLGDFCSTHKDENAEKNYKQALKLFYPFYIHNPYYYADNYIEILSNLGVWYSKNMKYKESSEMYMKAWEVAKNYPTKHYWTICLNYANAERRNKNYKQAQSIYEEILKHYVGYEIDDIYNRAICYHNLAILYNAIGDDKTVENHFLYFLDADKIYNKSLSEYNILSETEKNNKQINLSLCSLYTDYARYCLISDHKKMKKLLKQARKIAEQYDDKATLQKLIAIEVIYEATFK